MFSILSFIFLSEICYTIGQIFFKKAAGKSEPPKIDGVDAYLRFMASILVQPIIWLAFVIIGFAILFWVMALAQGDLSLVYPLSSMHYVLTLLGARFFLNEKIDRFKLSGTLLIVVGILLISRS